MKKKKIKTNKIISWQTLRDNCAWRVESQQRSRTKHEYGWNVSRWDCDRTGLPCSITGCDTWNRLLENIK